MDGKGPLSIVGVAGAMGLLVLFAYSFDPAATLVATHTGVLAEPLVRRRISGGTTAVQVRLASGDLVVADGPAELYGAPAGQPVTVLEFQSLVFRRPAFVVTAASR